MLERLARFDETRERRVHARQKLRLTPEAAVAIGDEHDDDRIDARKVLRVAVHAQTLPARVGVARGRGAAVRAEAVTPSQSSIERASPSALMSCAETRPCIATGRSSIGSTALDARAFTTLSVLASMD